MVNIGGWGGGASGRLRPRLPAALGLLLVASLALPMAARGATFSLQVSTASNRSAPVGLDGRTVSGTIYVFASPEAGATQVRFWLDNPAMTGTPTKSESNPPWDFAGTATNGAANPSNTNNLSDGSHSITASVTLSGGGTEVVTATFTVDNDSSPPPPSSHTLMVSTSSTRSNPSPLQGQTVAGSIYVFVSPDAGATRVRFWLDNPAMAGTPTKSEAGAPWDFAGTAANGAANPYNTNNLTDGSHSITASVTLSGGGAAVLNATFTVDNDSTPPPATHTLMVSTSSTRSNPVPLHGQTVSGSIYLFVSPESGATRVRFWLDNLSMAGTPTKSEGNPPWDFAGTAQNGAANPTNTSTLANGSHSITVSVDLTGGGSSVFTSTFTVSNQGVADQIHLAWVGDPARTLTVVWHTAQTTTPSEVQYRLAGTTTWLTATGGPRPSGTSGRLHEVTLTQLTPATRYEYRVRPDGGGWSAVRSARTAPGAGPATFDAIYFADTGIVGRLDGLATGTAQVIQEMAALDPLVYLPGGDYAYFDTDKRFGGLNNTIDAWFNQMQPAATKAPMMPTYGNHEALLQEGFDPWAARFPTPDGLDQRRNYSFDIGDVHFVSIFAVQGFTGLTSGQLAWIEADIEAAQADGARWIIPYFHVSPFSDGSSHPSNMALRAQLGPLFESLGVKVVLSSHDQSYERTYPLSGVPSSITRTSTSLSCYEMDDGVSWVKVSPAGKLSSENGSFSQFTTNPPPSYIAVRDNTMHHFVRIRVFASGVLRVETYGVVGNGSPPVILDSFEYRDGSCP